MTAVTVDQAKTEASILLSKSSRFILVTWTDKPDGKTADVAVAAAATPEDYAMGSVICNGRARDAYPMLYPMRSGGGLINPVTG